MEIPVTPPNTINGNNSPLNHPAQNPAIPAPITLTTPQGTLADNSPLPISEPFPTATPASQNQPSPPEPVPTHAAEIPAPLEGSSAEEPGKHKLQLNPKAKIAAMTAIFFIILLSMGSLGAMALARISPEGIFKLPPAMQRGVLALANSTPLTQSAQSVLFASTTSQKEISTFVANAEVKIDITGASPAQNMGLTMRLESPIDLEGKAVNSLKSKGNLFLELDFDEKSLIAQYPEYREVFENYLPKPPISIGLEAVLLSEKYYVYFESLPQAPMLKTEKLLKQWYFAENLTEFSPTSPDAKSQPEGLTQEQRTQIRTALNELLARSTLTKLPSVKEREINYHVVKIELTKQDVTVFLKALPLTRDDFYESAREQEQAIDEMMAEVYPNINDFSFEYWIESKTYYPGKIIFTTTTTPSINPLTQMILRTGGKMGVLPQVNAGSVAGANTTGDFSVTSTLTVSLRDHNKPITIEAPSNAKNIKDVNWEEIILYPESTSVPYTSEEMTQFMKSEDGKRLELASEMSNYTERYYTIYNIPPWKNQEPRSQCWQYSPEIVCVNNIAGVELDSIEGVYPGGESVITKNAEYIREILITERARETDGIIDFKMCFNPQTDEGKEYLFQSLELSPYDSEGQAWKEGSKYVCIPD